MRMNMFGRCILFLCANFVTHAVAGAVAPVMTDPRKDAHLDENGIAVEEKAVPSTNFTDDEDLQKALLEGVGLPCNEFCNASCCDFSNPPQACGGCDESFMCNPMGACYATGKPELVDRTTGERPPPKVKNAKGNCYDHCFDTPHCCWFGDPQNDCAGCDRRHGCGPHAECFLTGRGKSEL